MRCTNWLAGTRGWRHEPPLPPGGSAVTTLQLRDLTVRHPGPRRPSPSTGSRWRSRRAPRSAWSASPARASRLWPARSSGSPRCTAAKCCSTAVRCASVPAVTGGGWGGRIVETAPTEVLLSASRHPHTRELLESVPRLGAGVRDEGVAGGRTRWGPNRSRRWSRSDLPRDPRTGAHPSPLPRHQQRERQPQPVPAQQRERYVPAHRPSVTASRSGRHQYRPRSRAGHGMRTAAGAAK